MDLSTKFKKIGVLGAGQMGSGIAQVCAGWGASVVVVDSSNSQLEKAKAGIQRSAQKLLEKERISKEVHGCITNNLSFADSLESFGDCNLVIEAIVENEKIKAEVLAKISAIANEDCILATNTSSIPITRLASATKRPEKFIGMHFMNPVPIMKLVEIIPGMATDNQVKEDIKNLAIGLGKEVSLSQDYPGFVINRILMPMINEAFTALMEGVASAEDIDKGMKYGTNQPMGPLVLADFIGLDTCLAIMEVLHDGLGDSKYRPCPLLRKYVEAGYLGRKSGRGVYTY